MPTIRYEIRNEYGLADPELHRAADEDDPEALLEGVAMAGLVGVLRQLGDLAEFASEIFHDLHEEATSTAARGHGLMLRAQQLEADFQSIEKAFLSQTNPSPLAYNEGIDWHSNLRMDQNLVTQGDMPRFILDSYEECRGPPRLFMLDKFDVAGAGACLKRYSDPSFFKVDLASSGMMEEEVREKKARKIKRKGSRWRNGETTRSFLAPLIRSNLQPEQISAKVPMRHVRLKSRNLIDSDISNKRSYIEHLVEVNSPEQKVIDQFGLVAEVHETVTSTAVDSLILKNTNGTQPLAKMEAENFPKYGLANQKTKVIEMFTPVPDKKIMIESKAKQTATVCGNSLNEPEKYSPTLLEFDQKKSFDKTQITTPDGFDDHASAVKNRREAVLDGYSSDGMAMYPSYLQGLDQKNSFSNAVLALEGAFDGYRSDDLGSDLENYVDALTTMESEIETDSESREKSDAGVFDMEAHRIYGIKQQQQQKLPALFSEPDNVDNLSEKGLNNILISSPSSSETSCNLSDTQHSQEDTHDFSVPVIPEISLSETHVWTSEELQISGKVEESIPSAHLLINDTCNASGHEAMNAEAATVGAFSSYCVPESTSNGDHVFPQTSDETQTLTMLPEETFPGYVEGNNQVDQHLTGNLEEPSKYAVKSEIFPDGLLNLSDMEGSFFVGEDAPEDTHFMKDGDEASSVSQFPPSETFVGTVGNTHEGSQQLTTKKEVSESADNYDSNQLLPSPEIGSSISSSKGTLEEIHPEECPRKRIPEMSDKISMLDHLSLTQDCSSHDEAPRQFDETALFTREKILDINGEQKRSTEQETEALSGESIFLAIHSLSGNNGSAVVNSDDFAAEMVGIEKPENLPAEVFSNNVRLYHGVGENLPCNVHTSEPLSQDYEGMEPLKPASYSTISSDNLLPEFVVPERADTEEDTEEHFSKDTTNTMDDSIPEEVPTWCVKEPITSFTEEDAENCSEKMLPASNCDLPIETTPTVPHPYGLAAELDNSAAPSEDSIDDDLGETKFIRPNFLPLELEQLSARKEPQKSHEMDSAELLPGASVNNEFPDGRYLQSTEAVCIVIGGIDLTDNLGFPCVPRAPNFHEDEHIEECDDSLEAYVIVEADAHNQGACSLYSPKASAFDVDYLPSSAVLDSHSLETKERSYLKSTTAIPKIDNKEMSSPTDLCSEFPIVDSSYYSDAKLSHGVWKTAASNPNVVKGSSLYLSENEDSFSREGIDLPNQFLVGPAIPLVDGKERNVTSSNQEGKHLEVSDIQFETTSSDKQSNSKVIDDQSLEPEPHAILTTVEMNELDIHSSSDARFEQWEEEAVSFESPSEMFVDSMMSPIFPIIASSETSPQKCLEPQVLEATPSLQLQNVEGTTPFPPIPIAQEFSERQVVGAPSNLQIQDVESTLPLLPLPPVEWRKEKLMFVSGTSVGDTSQPQKATNPFVVLSPLDMKHPQGSLTDGFEVVQPTASPLWEDDLQGSLYSEGETRSGLPPITDKEGLMHGMKTQNPSRSEYERKSDGPDALMMALEDKITQHPDLLQGVQSIEDNRRLGQLLPSLELERSRHEPVSMADAVLPLNPLLAVSSSEEFKHQYGYGGESLQHLKMSAALPITGPNLPPYGFLYPMCENPSMIYDFMVPSMEGERPSRRHRSIRDLPRNPLIEAVVAHDKSTLRKVSELDPPRARPEADERDSLLEQIRNKSFNLKPANAPKLNMKGPPTNLKLAAILEKANAIRQACVGSDEDDDDGDSWSDS